MSFRKIFIIFLTGLGFLAMASLTFLRPNTVAQAQCGSQASSCKNCHEVQGQDPVNSDGTGWHQSHAFGDFCYICHAGNNQSMDEATAHTGMVPPLSDIKAGCQSCHPNDLTARAQVYASALGVSLEGGGSAPSGGGTAPSGGQGSTSPTGQGGEGVASGGETQQTAPQAPASGASVPEAASPEMKVDSENVVNYNQRYEEMALGKRQINWGNEILVILIVILLVGGGAFIYYNERKLRGLPISKAKASRMIALEAPVVEGYSPEVTALLPKIACLNPTGLHALKRLLEDPDTANELFHMLSKLDPELVRQVRSLDRSSRELLLAMSGD